MMTTTMTKAATIAAKIRRTDGTTEFVGRLTESGQLLFSDTMQGGKLIATGIYPTVERHGRFESGGYIKPYALIKGELFYKAGQVDRIWIYTIDGSDRVIVERCPIRECFGPEKAIVTDKATARKLWAELA